MNFGLFYSMIEILLKGTPLVAISGVENGEASPKDKIRDQNNLEF